MKIIYVDVFFSGHHVPYLKGLISDSNDDLIVIMPKHVPLPTSVKQIEIPYNSGKLKNYFIWLNRIYKIVEKEKPDIVHFLYGDVFYQYLGIGLSKFKKYKSLVTFHVIKNDIKHKVSMIFISRKITHGVIHTTRLMNQLKSWRINNFIQIEYPCFLQLNSFSIDYLKNKYSIPQNVPVLLAIGETSKYKGLNYLLDALKNVKGEFFLLIAGEEKFYSENYIQEETKSYSKKVLSILHRLSDQEFMDCLKMCDYVVLPYKEDFNGASGPLAEGVMYGKAIIGINKGSIGTLINNYNLGYTFEAENVTSLSLVIEKAINTKWIKSSEYFKYQQDLKPDIFLKKYKTLYWEMQK